MLVFFTKIYKILSFYQQDKNWLNLILMCWNKLSLLLFQDQLVKMDEKINLFFVSLFQLSPIKECYFPFS